MITKLGGLAVALVLAVVLAGCAGGYAIPAAAIGAATGAMIDHDDRGEGALVGGLLGYGAGGIVDEQRRANGYSPAQGYPEQYSQSQYSQSQGRMCPRGYRFFGEDYYGYPVCRPYQPQYTPHAPSYRQYR